MTSNSESSFLEATGGRSAANQKLMIVDQGTGEISFVKKSLAGINQNFTTEDILIKDALKNLLGDNMNNYGGYTKTGDNGVISKLLMGGSDKTNKEHTGWYYQQIKDLQSKVKAVEDDIKAFKKGNLMSSLRTTLDNKLDMVALSAALGTHRLVGH